MTVTEPQSLKARIEATRILVVDDEHTMRKVVRAMLTAIGVTDIHDANDGVSGLDAIARCRPDIVIVDWQMPRIDGAQFTRLVRSAAYCTVPDIPIIMLTGHGDRWRVVEAKRLGVDEFLLKPVSTKALLDRIVAILRKPRPNSDKLVYRGHLAELPSVAEPEPVGVEPQQAVIGDVLMLQDLMVVD